MKFIFVIYLFIFAIFSCNKSSPVRPTSLPDNIINDKPIVMKNGQAIVFMRDGDPHLVVAASVVDGRISVSEIDPKGRSFSITWKDSETWETATIVSDGPSHTYIMDKNMDGIADFKVEQTASGTRRFKSKVQEWEELK